MAVRFPARVIWHWLLPVLSVVSVQACSSPADRPSGIELSAGSGGSQSSGGKSAAGGNRASTGGAGASGGAPDAAGAAGTAGDTASGGDGGSVGSGGASGMTGSGGQSGAAGTSGASGGSASAGATGGGAGPTPVCGATQAWVDAPALAISTPDDDRFGSITPDELTVAWAISTGGGVTIEYADRAANDLGFDSPKTFSGAFALDRAALSADGLHLLLVNSDRRGFMEYTRATRSDDFGVLGPLLAFDDYAQNGMPAGHSFADPLLTPDDKTFIYSEYGSGVVDTIHQTKRLFSGDPWSPGTALVAAELEASGAERRKPTGLSNDGRTLFFWDDVQAQERAGFFVFQSDSFSSFVDLGQFIDAQPNAACTRLYHSAAGVSSLDLFVASAP